MEILLFLLWIFIPFLTESTTINIAPLQSGFVKYPGEFSDYYEIIYSNPLENKMNISVSFGSLKKTKYLEPLNYITNVFTDKTRFSIQSNQLTDTSTVYAICQFTHENSRPFEYNKVCCEMILKRSGINSKIFDRKYCQMDVNKDTSVCSVQFQILHDIFDFKTSPEVQLDISSRIFASQDGKCSSIAVGVSNLAFGYPTKLTIMQDLLVKWEIIDSTDSFGELLIGLPLDSMEPGSKSIFPLKINSTSVYNSITIQCSHGRSLKLSSISFDSMRFTGTLKKISDTTKEIYIEESISLENSGGQSVIELLVYLRIHHLNSIPNKISDNWISCKIIRASFDKNKSKISRKTTEKETKISIQVNIGHFYIFPILRRSTYFSILNTVMGPIEMGKNDLKILSAHNIGDESFSDITQTTECQPASPFALKCPFARKNNNVMAKKIIRKPDWNVVLSLRSWKKTVKVPIELWQADDWRLTTTDRTLNKISGWNYKKPDYSCKPLFQVTRCKLIARLMKDTFDSIKSYYGQSELDKIPLLDMTPYLKKQNIKLSTNNVDVDLKNDFMLLQKVQMGPSEISIIDNHISKIAFDFIQVDNQEVSIVDMEVSCIHDIHINHTINSNDLPFHKILVSQKPSEDPTQACYFQILLTFNDNTKSNLADYKFSNFQLKLIHTERSVDIKDLDSFIYYPSQYKEPGKFILQLLESNECSFKLIFQKDVNIYENKKSKNPIDPSLQSPVINYSQSTSTEISIVSSSSTKSLSKQLTVTSAKSIDTDTLFLTMKILIGLVIFVVLIIILNFLIKIRNRKSASLLDRHLNNCQIYGQVEKLTTSAYTPLEIASQNPNNQHPPLLPPPGPLYNSSNSSQMELTVNATPDRFWDLSHTVDKAERKMTTNHMVLGMQMNPFTGQGHSITFPNVFSNSRTSSSPHSDQIEFGYTNSSGSKLSHSRGLQQSQNGFSYPPGSIHDSDSLASGSGSKTSSQIAVIVPPCPPLRWNNNWNSNQFPGYFPNDKDTNLDPSISQFSNEQSSQISLTNSHSSSWEIKQPLVLPPMGFNSIENVCEKSSGVGSLTSTQPGSDCSKKESTSTHTNSPNITNYSTSH